MTREIELLEQIRMIGLVGLLGITFVLVFKVVLYLRIIRNLNLALVLLKLIKEYLIVIKNYYEIASKQREHAEKALTQVTEATKEIKDIVHTDNKSK